MFGLQSRYPFVYCIIQYSAVYTFGLIAPKTEEAPIAASTPVSMKRLRIRGCNDVSDRFDAVSPCE